MTYVDLWIALPLLLLAVGALVTLIAGAALKHDDVAYRIAAVTLAGTACWSILLPPGNVAPVLGLCANSLTRLFVGFFALSAWAVLVFSRQYNRWRGITGEEYPATVLFTTFGMVALAGSSNLMTLFLGLEAMSFGFYFLVGCDLRRERPSGVGMKYLLIGGISAALLAFGIALIYCAAGTLEVARAFLPASAISLAGWSFLLIGIAFKLSLVPAHLWTPDIYAEAPAPVTAFLSAGSKGAAVLLLLLILPRVGDSALLRLPLWWFALLSMLLGNLGALRQTSLRRILAYSSIAQMGYVTLALVSATGAGYRAAAYYMLAYGVISLAAFGVVAIMERAGIDDTVEACRGLGSRHPFAALVFTLALFALAGIPPSAGFTGKFLIFSAAIQAGELPLALIGILTTLVSVYYYLRIVVAVYMQPPSTSGDVADGLPCVSERLVLVLLSLVVILCGMFPSQVYAVIAASLP